MDLGRFKRKQSHYIDESFDAADTVELQIIPELADQEPYTPRSEQTTQLASESTDWTSVFNRVHNAAAKRLSFFQPVWRALRRVSGSVLFVRMLLVAGLLISLAGSVIWGIQSGRVKTPASSGNQSTQKTADGSIPLKTDGQSLTVQGTNQGLINKNYSTDFEGAKTNVTVQIAPDNFKKDPATALTAFAKTMKANQPIETSTWGRAYLLTSDGVQVVVMSNGRYLVIVQSFAAHQPAQWTQYLDAIKP